MSQVPIISAHSFGMHPPDELELVVELLEALPPELLLDPLLLEPAVDELDEPGVQPGT
jgi:hypothetical protein